MKLRFVLFISLLLFISNFLAAQSTDEIKKRFPGEQVVVKNHKVHYKLKLENGLPKAESRVEQELMYLSENAGSFMSRYSFYNSSFHKVLNYEAYTEPPSGKKIPVKEFKPSHSTSGSVFYDDVEEINFDFPSVTPGSVGRLEYTVQHTDPRLLSPHYFSRFVPVLNGELKISFPKEISVKYFIRGNHPDKINFSSESRKGETTFTFTVTNLEPELSYPDAPDNSYYSLHVIFYIAAITVDGNTASYMSNLDDLYRLDWGFIKGLNKEPGRELKNITDSLTKGLNTKEEKAKNIYRWVQKNIKYVAFEEGMEGFIPREANLVCTRRYGDCKDMSSILTVMLNHAGIPAYYTWIGSRALPYDYTDVPLPVTDNHMITTIRLDTGYVFLDGTDSYCLFGAPSGHIQGKQAMLSINEKEYLILRVPEYEKKYNQLTDTTILSITDKGVSGSINIHMSGYYAMQMHNIIDMVKERDREKFFKGYFNRGSNKFRLNKYEVMPGDELNSFRLSGNFELEGYVRKIAGEIYLNLDLFKHFEHQEIDYPRRNIPIEHDYKNIRKYVTILNLPEGFEVSFVPENKSFHNDVWGFDMTYEKQKNQLVMTQSFDNNYLLLHPSRFQEWNKVLEKMLPACRETVSLSIIKK